MSCEKDFKQLQRGQLEVEKSKGQSISDKIEPLKAAAAVEEDLR